MRYWPRLQARAAAALAGEAITLRSRLAVGAEPDRIDHAICVG